MRDFLPNCENCKEYQTVAREMIFWQEQCKTLEEDNRELEKELRHKREEVKYLEGNQNRVIYNYESQIKELRNRLRGLEKSNGRN